MYTIKNLIDMGVNVCKQAKNIQISKNVRIINPSNLYLKDNIRIDDYTCISASGKIEINNYIHIARNCYIFSGKDHKIFLDDFCGISLNTILLGKTDDFSGSFLMGPTIPDKYTNVIHGDIIFGKGVVIGATSVIFPDTIIHDNTVVGSLSLVKGTLEPNYIYAGNPLKKLKKRKTDNIQMQNEILNIK